LERLNNFTQVYKQLEKFARKENLNELEEQGLIQYFEYNYELSWNVIKDFYEFQGDTNIQGSRDAFRLAFSRGLISDGELWIDLIKNRQLTFHTYNQARAKELVKKIRTSYCQAFKSLGLALRDLSK
jgi:nucleotidyltransferase substrate binding protein (TIGR01987 family)